MWETKNLEMLMIFGRIEIYIAHIICVTLTQKEPTIYY